MRASSSSQNRGAGMPWKVTGAGITVRVITSPGASCPVPMLMSPLRSKEYQSRVPSAYCCAVRVRSPNTSSPRRVDSEKVCSIRSGCQVCPSWGAPAPGSLNSVSDQVTHAR